MNKRQPAPGAMRSAYAIGLISRVQHVIWRRDNRLVPEAVRQFKGAARHRARTSRVDQSRVASLHCCRLLKATFTHSLQFLFQPHTV